MLYMLFLIPGCTKSSTFERGIVQTHADDREKEAEILGEVFPNCLQQSPPPRTGVESPPVGQTLGSGESPDGGYV